MQVNLATLGNRSVLSKSTTIHRLLSLEDASSFDSRRSSVSAGVLVETTFLIVLLVALIGVIIDLRFMLVEKNCMEEASRFGARLAALAPAAGFAPQKISDFVIDVTASSLETCGVNPERYRIEYNGNRIEMFGARNRLGRVRIHSQRPDGFFLLRSNIFNQFAESLYLKESTT